MKKLTSEHLMQGQKAELEALAALPEDQIQTDDMPEVTDFAVPSAGCFIVQSSSKSRCA